MVQLSRLSCRASNVMIFLSLMSVDLSYVSFVVSGNGRHYPISLLIELMWLRNSSILIECKKLYSFLFKIYDIFKISELVKGSVQNTT